MSTPWTVSPITEAMSNDVYELTDGLEIDGGALEANGTDGGFIDEFDGAVVDATNWPVNSNGILDGNGNLTFDNVGNTGWSQRYVISKLVGINFGS